jgi:hypothetical protein
MTIGEYLQEQARAARRIKWGMVVVGIAGAFIGVFAGAPKNFGYWLGFGIAAVAFPLLLRPIKRMRCPRCNGFLFMTSKDAKGEPMRVCEKCGADFTQPMPTGPINPTG